MYFNYHAKAKQLIKEGKLIYWYITDNYKNIGPAIVLVFADYKHTSMPIRKHKWEEYFEILPIDKKKDI